MAGQRATDATLRLILPAPVWGLAGVWAHVPLACISHLHRHALRTKDKKQKVRARRTMELHCYRITHRIIIPCLLSVLPVRLQTAQRSSPQYNNIETIYILNPITTQFSHPQLNAKH
ncbi:hypothetical protein V8C35DRAFT_298666, partial [Trichoderma chlorosporum]